MPAFEIAKRYGRMNWEWAVLFTVFALVTISSIYEILEWLLTLIVSPAHAEAYNGQQGDFWDAQKDMAIAFAGSIFAVSVIVIRYRRRATG